MIRRTALPANDRKVIAVSGPRKPFLCLLQFLQFHGELTFANFVLWENLGSMIVLLQKRLLDKARQTFR